MKILARAALAIALSVSVITAQATQPSEDNTVIPEYPAKALSKKVEGHVTLSFDVNEKGEAVDIEVVNFAGTKHFIRSSVKALKQTRFESMSASDMQKRYDFYLDNENQDSAQIIAFNR